MSHPKQKYNYSHDLVRLGIKAYNLKMDLSNRLKNIVFFEIAQDLSFLTENERSALAHCIKASKIMTAIYLRQVSFNNHKLYEEIKQRTNDNLLKYFEINGGPWDRFRENQPFIPKIGAKPKGAAFYPGDLSEKEWDFYLDDHPEERELFESPCTIIQRKNSQLVVIPYSVAYRDLLEEAASELRAAVTLLKEGELKKFLCLRADSFLTNNYWESDIAWIDTNGDPFEVTIGPYEVYEDRFMGLKSTFEAFIGLPDQEWSAKLQKFSHAVPDFDKALSERFNYRSKAKETAIPLEVVLDVYRGGEAAFGRQFVAYNLPNDRKIHETKGSKKIFSRTMMEAKFSKVSQLVAEKILKPQDLDQFHFEKRFSFVLGHELAHGLGPSTVKIGEREVPFEILLRDLHSSLEEAKADALGAALLNHFAKQNLLNFDDLTGCVTTQLVKYVQEFRMGFTEAHAAGSLVQYNWLKDHKAISYNKTEKVFDIDPEKSILALEKLSEQLLLIQMEGNYEKAKSFIGQWSKIPSEITGIVADLSSVPFEVYPTYKL